MISREISARLRGVSSPEMFAEVETIGAPACAASPGRRHGRESVRPASPLRDEVRGDARSSGQDQRERLGGQLLHFEGDAGGLVNVPHDHIGRGAEHQHRFLVFAALEAVDPLDRFGVGGVAADAPDRVGRVEDHSSFTKDPDASVTACSMVSVAIMFFEFADTPGAERFPGAVLC